MFEAETALLEAVRGQLQTAMSLDAHECEVEMDDEVPSIASDHYVAVTAAGAAPGRRHRTSGGVWDLQFGVRVVVYQRIADVARDRRRNPFLQHTDGLNAMLGDVIRAVDFNYPILNTANTALNANLATADDYDEDELTTIGGKFLEPLKLQQLDAGPRSVFKDPYAAANHQTKMPSDPIVALRRGVVFSGARYLKDR
jgi:hypothetical protein